MEERLAFDNDGLKLAGREERVQDIAEAGAGGEGGEEGFSFVFCCCESLPQIERDERAEGGGLAGVGTGFDLLGEARGGELPEGGGAVKLRDGQDTELRPELCEGAQDGGFSDFLAELGGELGRRKGDLGSEDFICGEGEGETLTEPAVTGGCFQALLPRRVKT